MEQLPADVWRVVVRHLAFDTVCTARGASSAVRWTLQQVERDVADDYATRILGDAAFWARAMRRDPATSRTLPTWHAEVVRVHGFVQRMRPCVVRATDLYRWWAVVDRVLRPVVVKQTQS